MGVCEAWHKGWPSSPASPTHASGHPVWPVERPLFTSSWEGHPECSTVFNNAGRPSASADLFPVKMSQFCSADVPVLTSHLRLVPGTCENPTRGKQCADVWMCFRPSAYSIWDNTMVLLNWQTFLNSENFSTVEFKSDSSPKKVILGFYVSEMHIKYPSFWITQF